MKKLLLISYYFPPAGGVSVQRVLKFAKYLPEFGWEPVILTVKNGSYPVLDENLASQLPADLSVHRVKGWEPFQTYAKFIGKNSKKGASTSFSSDRPVDWKEKLSRSIRGNLFIPDARKGWVKEAIKKGSELIQSGDIEAILSSGPPHSTHLIARGIKAQTGIPWIADFRDLWTEIDYKDQMPQTKMAASIDARMEKSVLEMADSVITVSPSCKSSLENLGYPIQCDVIPNGFDPADYDEVFPVADGKEKVFTITYAGTMGPTRNPAGLWRSLSQLKKDGELNSFRLQFFGTVDSSVRKLLSSLALEDYCSFKGSISHKDVLREMMQSDLLLLVINRVSESTMAGITPGKMFEYMATGVPILGVGNRSGDAAGILEATKSGQMMDYDDDESLRNYLLQNYLEWSSNRKARESRTQDPLLKAYSRVGQAEALANKLNGLSN